MSTHESQSTTLRSPAEIVGYIAHAGAEKARLHPGRLTGIAVLGGMFIGIGTILAVIVAGGCTGLAASNPGLVKFIFGALFPLGFIAVTLTGADLFTSNCALGASAVLRGELGVGEMLRFWGISYIGNFIGAVGAAYFLVYLTHLINPGDPATQYLVGIAEGKTSHPFMMTFMKGVLANVLVCVATMQGYSAKDTFGRVLGIWFPVMAFVTLGMEHSIANMFIIPAAMLGGADISWGQFIVSNLIPATLGNIVGGALVIGLPYTLIYGEQNAPRFGRRRQREADYGRGIADTVE
ncbi:formate/nitrite transporter family protein [Jeongeupia naejangsanensis]|uniref:Formate/nitrite transporter family protein n=1 Tax=Jeongeupia naejangsanensis TaxID=613195 RepID=A0ABS2BM50_9NEIS|nr:formate/nitrite transporter family protein [Jeongeupia naejangsanensis]MBM3116702.1 formate/nitrite transporter family protein [Jeongeupia naejangsanensis]